MTRLRTISAALAAVTTLASAMAAYGQALPSSTDSFAPYGPFGGWNVFVNETRGSCFAERVTDAYVLQMGITEPAIFAYLGVFTQAPTDAQSGRVEEVELMIGDRRFVGEVTEEAGNIPGGFSGGYIVSRDFGLIDALGAADTMTVTVGGRESIEVDLTGTADGIAAVRDCSTEQVG